MAYKFELSIFCFRRDFRIIDNTALIAASKLSAKVLPVFCFDKRQISSSLNPFFAHNCFQFMIQSLKELDQQLISKNSKLHVFTGLPHQVLPNLCLKTGAKAVFFNQDYSPFSKERDRLIEEACQSKGVKVVTLQDYLLVPIKKLPEGFRFYKVFTPFYKRLSQQTVSKPNLAEIDNFYNKKIQGQSQWPEFKSNPSLHCHGGRDKALALLDALPQKYSKTRDFPSLENGTSGLAPYIKFGSVSIREVFYKIQKMKSNQDSEALGRQLYWRQFYCHINNNNGYKCFISKYTDLPWQNDQKLFQLWKEGKTGVPIVDAAMRQLKQTGYMHNRLRMIVSSFLTKDLLITWQWGQKHFANYLIDYDPAQNNGGWQWAASTGCDPQPYFRIFNPYLQSERFDKQCKYIKKWVPELRQLNAKEIHNWESSKQKIKSYLKPVVVHAQQKQKALALFKGVKSE